MLEREPAASGCGGGKGWSVSTWSSRFSDGAPSHHLPLLAKTQSATPARSGSAAIARCSVGSCSGVMMGWFGSGACGGWRAGSCGGGAGGCGRPGQPVGDGGVLFGVFVQWQIGNSERSLFLPE